MPEVPDRLTPVAPRLFFQTLAKAWTHIFGSLPQREQLLVLMAQSALETGHWKFVHCYNFGNVKAVPNSSRQYCFFACNEILSIAHALRLDNGTTAKITRDRRDGTAEIWFYPPHPACCFRAYAADNEADAMLAGMVDYLEILYGKYTAAWDEVLNGDPAEFVNRLKAAKYFTADLAGYRTSVVSIFTSYSKQDLGPIPTLADVPATPPIMELVWRTLDESLQESMKEDLARLYEDK